jgi:hypothetical protein
MLWKFADSVLYDACARSAWPAPRSTVQQVKPMTELEAARTDDVNLVSKSIFELGDELSSVEASLREMRARIFVHHMSKSRDSLSTLLIVAL